MSLQLLVNEAYEPNYDDRRRHQLSMFTNEELRQKIERMASVRSYGKNRSKLSKNMRQKLDAKLKTKTAEELEYYNVRWNMAMGITRQKRLQDVIVGLIKTEQRIKRIRDEIKERLLERPRLKLLINNDQAETSGLRQLRANMRAFDRRNKGDK